MSTITDNDNLIDIEDIFNKNNFENFQRIKCDDVVPKVKIARLRNDNQNLETYCLDSFVPGTQRIYFKTWGCSHNTSDGEYMAGLLAANGYQIVNDGKDAHLWILNSCTVKNPSEDHFRNSIQAGLLNNKKIVVAGCVSQATPYVDYLRNISIIGVQQIDRVVEVVEETLKGNKVRLLGKKKLNTKKTGGANLSLPKIRKNPLIEIIPISTGCLNHCTYCKTKHARGELGSYPIEDIVNRAQEAFKEGVKEVWLTSEDTGAYGLDIGLSLPQLLNSLITVIPSDARLRLGMTNPPYILEHLEEMVKIFSNPKIYSFLHIPVQSGSDSVLMDMKREYCIKDFEDIIDFLKKKIPNITIATDIICGFPTETEEDFKCTMDLVERHKFPSLFINQFYPRPGTPAARMKRVPTQEVKQRTKRLTELFESYKPYENKTGKIDIILVTEESRDKKYYVGHNQYYEQILIPKDDYFMGKMVKVKIISSAKHYMMAIPLTSFLSFHISKFIKNYFKMDQNMFGLIVFNLLIVFSIIVKLVYKS